MALAAVAQDGWALQHASAKLEADREVALAAVAQDGWALQHASKILRKDYQVVLAAVAQMGLALQYALKPNRDVVLAALAQNVVRFNMPLPN